MANGKRETTEAKVMNRKDKITALQIILGVTPDGILGPNTRTAFYALDIENLDEGHAISIPRLQITVMNHDARILRLERNLKSFADSSNFLLPNLVY
jgi:hypothetical protein